MTKKKQLQKPKWKFPTHLAADVLKIIASHPVTMGMAIMTASALGMAALAKSVQEAGDKESRSKDLYHQLAGLYQGTQGIATLAVAVPVIVAGVQAAGGVATSYFAKAPEEKKPQQP